MSENCRVRSNLPQVQTTNPVLTTQETTRHFSQPDTDVVRKRRKAAQEAVMAKGSTDISDKTNRGKNIKWTTFVVEPTSVVSEVNIWIKVGCVLGALALLIIVIIILWKCGFFNRKKTQSSARMETSKSVQSQKFKNAPKR